MLLVFGSDRIKLGRYVNNEMIGIEQGELSHIYFVFAQDPKVRHGSFTVTLRLEVFIHQQT